MKNVNPFSTNYSIPYHKIGREEVPKKNRKKKDIENLRYGDTITDEEEIKLCMNCTKEKCTGNCGIIREYRRTKKAEARREKMNG